MKVIASRWSKRISQTSGQEIQTEVEWGREQKVEWRSGTLASENRVLAKHSPALVVGMAENRLLTVNPVSLDTLHSLVHTLYSSKDWMWKHWFQSLVKILLAEAQGKAEQLPEGPQHRRKQAFTCRSQEPTKHPC
jgi:hypothetical protein